ncbi:MAG: 3-deoxy-manno-octulosonate cytidylyltransferase [Methyloligellaceae bacterium]
MQTLIIIPARYGSTRFPGKPLFNIKGKTLLQRVIRIAEQASEGNNARFLVATDHEDILKHCNDLGAPAVMTDTDLASGTDRALAAIEADGSQPDFVINLQGDAPFTPAAHVSKLIESAKTLEGDVFTPVIKLDWEALDMLRERKKTTPFSGTTCVRTPDGKAFWFSKNILPAIRKEDDLRATSTLSPVFRHIGLYGYRMEALRKFAELPPGFYEIMEGLEQLRFLENGMSIQAVEVDTPAISMSGVDTREDAELAIQLIEKTGDPYDDGSLQ